MNRIWTCPFCLSRNHLPAAYAEISPENLPAELLPNYTTVEYTSTQPVSAPPAFLFVIDTCFHDDELQMLKEGVSASLALLPPNSLVGLITFGKDVSGNGVVSRPC